jgi:hypothetical protein
LEIERVAEVLQTYPGTSIHLSGHTDATGSPDYNMLLSNQRVVKIVEYLEMRGIDPDRITAEGKGENAPVARNIYPDGSDAPLGRYLNRQVIVTLESPEPMQIELSGFYVPGPLKFTARPDDSGTSFYWFTVQLAAHVYPLGSSYFKNISPVEKYECKDGYFRYAFGKFRTFDEARLALEKIEVSGYPDAFIQTIAWYERVIK